MLMTLTPIISAACGFAHVPLGGHKERYARRENIALYQRLLAEVNVTKDQVRHAELTRLLAAEIAKDVKPPDS